jgi:FkbM family methyltransferase
MMFNIKKNLKKFKFIRTIVLKLRSKSKRFAIFNFLNSNSIVLDFGANIGDVSQYLNDMFNCKIYCYEPDPNAYNFLKQRFKNNYSINTSNLAITNDGQEKKLYFHKQSKIGGQISYSEASSLLDKKENISQNNFYIVKSINIKELLNNFEYIDLIKIDIEGYEYEILPILIQNNKKIGKIICELHGNPLVKDKATGKIKNQHLTEKYLKLVDNLKNLDLYEKWFIEWD